MHPIQIDLVKGDFKNFLYLVWKHLGLPPPTPIQYELADYLQYGDNRKMLEAFRGVGKSWITSAYVCWRLLCDSNEKFLVVSASKQRSDDFVTFTKRLIAEISCLRHLKAKAGQRDTMVAFDVGTARAAHAPSVKAAGILGQITGSRANEIIADDIEVPNNSSTEDMRDKLEKASKEFEAIIVPGGRITFLGTPQTEESIYNKLPERGYSVRIWTARYPLCSKVANYKGHLAPSITDRLEQDPSCEGMPTDPLRFTDFDLFGREASYGRSGFLLQFMLDTSLSDADRYPLKLADLVVTAVNGSKAPSLIQWASSPELQCRELQNVGFTGDRWFRPLFMDKEWLPYSGSVMFIDPSGRGADETSYAVVKHLHGTLFLTASGGFKGGYDEKTLVSLAEIAKDQRVNQVLIEANFGDGMWTEIFKPILRRSWECAVEEVKHHIQKEQRIIDTLEPLLIRHRLVVDIDVIKADILQAQDDPKMSLFYQLTHITKERGSLRHDDRLDALAGAVAYWIQSMSRDEVTASEEHKTALLEAELQRFMDHCIGSTNGTNAGGRWGIPGFMS